jgi:hypothetical protein
MQGRLQASGFVCRVLLAKRSEAVARNRAKRCSVLTSCLNDEHLDLVNEILPKVSAKGAYMMGLATSLVMLSPEGMIQTRELYERAANCETPSEVVRCFEEWELRLRERGKVATSGRAPRGARKA